MSVACWGSKSLDWDLNPKPPRWFRVLGQFWVEGLGVVGLGFTLGFRV